MKSDFTIFQPPCGARNLWDLVLVLCEVDESLLPASYRKGIVHTKHLVRHKAVSIGCLLIRTLLSNHSSLKGQLRLLAHISYDLIWKLIALSVAMPESDWLSFLSVQAFRI